MNILLTNDDGFSSKGIQLLKKLLSKYGRVVIFAPDSPMSAKSTSITITKLLTYKEEEKDVYSCSGTPADTVGFAMSVLPIKFDLVVSGCNDGLNVSYDTLFSGTIGASLAALTFRIPTIAVSCDGNFELVERYFDQIYDFINKNDLLSLEYVISINFPVGNTVKDIKLSSLYYRKDDYQFIKTANGYQAYRECQKDFSDQKDSDCYHVYHDIVSITPLSKTYFHSTNLEELTKKIK